MFSQSLIQNLIDLYTGDLELVSCYILDELQDVNHTILANSRNIIYFRSCLVSESDIEIINEKLKYSSKKNMTILSIYLNPDIVKSLLISYPNLTFFSVFHSHLLNNENRDRLINNDNKDVEYSYSKDYMGTESMCQQFRKLIFNFFDDN